MFKRYKKYFDSLGTPASAKRIKDNEAALGRELPAAYREPLDEMMAYARQQGFISSPA